MWKALASIVCGCLAALPLIGCAGDVTTARRAGAATPVAGADISTYYNGGPRVHAASPAPPTAILVLLPALGAAGSEDALTRDPALRAAQGFDVVMPQPEEIYRLVTDQQAALARLVASAHALADAPIWLVGAGPTIDAALRRRRNGGAARSQVS